MAEFWKSTPKYYCKQCNVFIRDTAFERSQHEATAKHQGNLKRFLRNIHRDSERQERESSKAKSEVERLKRTVSGQPSSSFKDTGTPLWKRASPPFKPTPRPASLEERKKQISQLADMGIAIPQEFRAEMAMAGDWQTISEKIVQPEDSESMPTAGIRKRKHGEGEGEEEDEDLETGAFVSKDWGSRVREYPGTPDDGDLDALLESTCNIIKPKQTVSDTAGQGDSKKSGKAPVKSEEGAAEDEQSSQAQKEGHVLPGGSSILSVENRSEKLESEPVLDVVFKKRKPKVMRK